MGWLKGTARLFGPSIAVGFVAPFIFPGVRRALRPVVKGLIRGGLSIGESFREATAATRAELGDLVAEAKADHERQARNLKPEKDEKE